ncbi:gamma-secretase subunit APH-1B isoform X1 [Manis javanica]|uniref:gamma-secretase subunit APH-1B isoform X1 n=1 Tax=Manis javanica TaxID=9974 RepID=UPI003C6D43F8
MTAAVFFGCAFIAFGPALALYIFTIATEPLRVIFLIVGAFFWLVSLLFSSFVWFMAGTITNNKDGPVQKYMLIFGVLVSVLIQEMFRFAYYKLLKKANEGLKSINPDETAPSMRLLAYVSGLGFGIMSGVFSFVNTLSDSLGPGTVGIHGDSPQFFLNSAFMTLVIILLHMFWGIVFFDGCEKRKWYALLVVLLTHLLVSALGCHLDTAEQTCTLMSVGEVRPVCLCGSWCSSTRDTHYMSGETYTPAAINLHKLSLWDKSGVSVYNHGAHGHLGILCCWRQLPKPETLPALPRQGLPPSRPALQITSENQHL